jgi:acyl carrier protein
MNSAESKRGLIEKRVIEVIREKAGFSSEIKITGQSSLEEGVVHMDSLDKYETIYALEGEFDVSIPDERAGEFKRVDEIVDYIDQHRESYP